jgi:hypothetical protein
MVRLEVAGYGVVLHVHDEIVCEVSDGFGDLDEFKRLIETVPDWAAGLPVRSKVRNGARFSKSSPAAVEYATLPPLPPVETSEPKYDRPPALTAAKPVRVIEGTPRLDSAEPFERIVAWAIEREATRLRKAAGQPPPWSVDPIIAAGRFCNVFREFDRVTLWITANVVEPHRDDPNLWFAIADARFINEPSALNELGYPVPFDAVHFRAVLEARQTRGDKVYRTDAYKPPLPPKELKGMGTTEYLAEHVLGPMWRDHEQLRPQSGETLAAYCDRLQEYPRVGPFLAAQIVADLKGVGPLRSAPDWWQFAAPGPGSKRGLARVCGLPVRHAWSEAHWIRELAKLRAETAPYFAAAGMAPLDAQNTQNICCEFDKWERARQRQGEAL